MHSPPPSVSSSPPIILSNCIPLQSETIWNPIFVLSLPMKGVISQSPVSVQFHILCTLISWLHHLLSMNVRICGTQGQLFCSMKLIPISYCLTSVIDACCFFGDIRLPLLLNTYQKHNCVCCYWPLWEVAWCNLALLLLQLCGQLHITLLYLLPHISNIAKALHQIHHWLLPPNPFSSLNGVLP